LNYTIEIATSNYSSTAAAVKGGASRIELCSALSEGGLTPSHGYMVKCRNDFATPLFPIIRPRGRDFLYTQEEFEVIKKDVAFCKQQNFNGVVTGFLNEDGTIDENRLSTIVGLAYPMEVTFHRAFDRCKNPFEALEDIINAGCTRILTSGQKLKAEEGAGLIQDLVIVAANRIIIMPGSGVRKENIAELARQTGAREFHASLRSTSKSNMQFLHPAFKNEAGEYTHDTIDPGEVQAMFEALNQKPNI
jgi:copper homeostasis protein